MDKGEKQQYENRLHEIESSLQRQREMELQHQQENDLRRKREIELVNRLNRLEQQRLEEQRQLHEVENALKQQLEESQRRYLALETERNQEQAAREEELRRLQEREQLLTHELKAVRITNNSPVFLPHDATPCQPQNMAQFHLQGATLDHQQQDVLVGQDKGVSNPLTTSVSGSQFNQYEEDVCSVAYSDRDVPCPIAINPLGRVETPCTFTINNELGSNHTGQGHTQFYPYRPHELNSLGSNNLIQGQFGPTRQHIVARQVIPKELPVFSGDPTEWPLFISSYQHSTLS